MKYAQLLIIPFMFFTFLGLLSQTAMVKAIEIPSEDAIQLNQTIIK